jgi:hypothetical protein
MSLNDFWFVVSILTFVVALTALALVIMEYACRHARFTLVGIAGEGDLDAQKLWLVQR